MIVTAYGEEFECVRAVRGENFIRLYGLDGNVFASFEGVSDFTGYSIADGTWEDLTKAPTIDERVTTLEVDSAETREALEMILTGVTE